MEKLIHKDLGIVVIQGLVIMQPTEAQVLKYVTEHPGHKSKAIAKFFGVHKDIINRGRPGYRGIYSMKDVIVSKNYEHSPVNPSEPATEAEQSCIYDEAPIVAHPDFAALKLAMQAQAEEHKLALEAMQELIDKLASDFADLSKQVNSKPKLEEPKPKLKLRLKPKLHLEAP